jgi:hypothetical protein
MTILVAKEKIEANQKGMVVIIYSGIITVPFFVSLKCRIIV